MARTELPRIFIISSICQENIFFVAHYILGAEKHKQFNLYSRHFCRQIVFHNKWSKRDKENENEIVT